MATTTKARAVKVFEADGMAVYATPTGVKVGSRGKVRHPGVLYSELPKGEARKVRKALHKGGFVAHAAAVRSAF